MATASSFYRIVTIDFKAVDTQTQLSLVHTGFSTSPGRDHHIDGWQQTLESFEQYLSTQK